MECLCRDIKLAMGVKSGLGDICILVLVEEKRFLLFSRHARPSLLRHVNVALYDIALHNIAPHINVAPHVNALCT